MDIVEDAPERENPWNLLPDWYSLHFPSKSPSSEPTAVVKKTSKQMHEEKLREYVPMMNEIFEFHELKLKLEVGEVYTKPFSVLVTGFLRL